MTKQGKFLKTNSGIVGKVIYEDFYYVDLQLPDYRIIIDMKNRTTKVADAEIKLWNLKRMAYDA